AMDSLAAAEAVLAEAATRYPEHARALYWLGDVRLRRGRPADALPPLERAVAVQPAFVEAQVKRAEALAGSGRLAEAAAAYRAALDADPVHLPGAWNDLGFLLLQQNRMAEATPLFERAVALDPDLVPALVNLGSVRMLAGALDDAAAHFEQALRQEPDHLPALGNLGLVYAQLGRYEEARERLRRVLALAPGDARAAAALDQVEQRIRERS
ncbi:MAG: tetratricopeptide repeat protein, partial [Rhodothermales bacterium]|nr:tetratricopeptide repeat protein [Rhodothermales bacterium]